MSLSSLLKKPKPLLSTEPDANDRAAGLSAEVGGEFKKFTYSRVLTGVDGESPTTNARNRAWKALQKSMVLIPTGSTLLLSRPVGETQDPDESGESGQHVQLVEVPGCYVDRTAVTCADFSAFVRAGGYTDMQLWPKEIWPHVVQFIDQTGHPGPKFWQQGRPARDQMEHPVTGISWYEAAAYSVWIGKRLPDPSQWQRAGTWQVNQEGKQNGVKYPWGNMFEPKRANIWASGIETTVPVDQYYEGCTSNGIFQLIGNVWEWVDGHFVCPGAHQLSSIEMGEIRGGAFDTYFANQATCQFRSGHPKLYRAPNIGFRCCVPIHELKHAPQMT